MWSTFVTWLADNYPLVFLFVGVVSLTIFCCHKVYKFYYKRFVKVEKDVEDHGDHLEDIHLNLTGIKKTTTRIEFFLQHKHRDEYPALLTFESPYVLTEKGERVLKESGAESLINHELQLYLSHIAEKEPATALDVENIIRKKLLNLSDTPLFTAIKQFVFRNPSSQDTPIDLFTIIDLMVIKIREEYMKIHPEVPNEEPAVNDKPSD